MANCPDERSLFKASALEGHCYLVDTSGHSLRKFWQPPLYFPNPVWSVLPKLSGQTQQCDSPARAREALSKNGTQLRESTWDQWCLNRGTLQLMAPGVRRDPMHFDGGASLIFGSLSLWGDRQVLLVGADKKKLLMKPTPGHFYLTSMCSVEHRVLHRDAGDQ